MKIIVMGSQIGDLSSCRGENAVRDEWVTARAEGRSGINCGLGFGEMGHEVEIFYPVFKNAQITKNVKLINNIPSDSYYDIAYSVRTQLYRGKCGRHLNSITPEDHSPKYATQMKRDFPNIEFYGNNFLQTAMFQKPGMLVEPIPLPYLFPIPTLPGLKEQGFLAPSWDKDKKEQNVFLYNGRIPWDGYETALKVLRRLRDHHKYDLKIFKFTNMRGGEQIESWDGVIPFEAEILKEFDVTVIDSWKQSYFDVITLLQKMDMCITKGDPGAPGNCAFDIISLGKLFFYTTVEQWRPQAINEQFRVPWSINSESDKDKIEAKVDSIVSNPRKSVEDFQKSIIHFSYPVWKMYMEKILNKNVGV